MDEIKKMTGLIADDVRAMFAESRANMDRMSREADERAKEADERAKEADERFRKSVEEADRRAKEADERLKKLEKQVGGVSNNAGFHAERFFQDALAGTLTFGGEKYDCMYPNQKYVKKNEGAEFDILLVNGKSVAIIEAKSRIHPTDVQKMTEEKLVKLRKYFPIYKDHKVYLGLAGFSFDDAVWEEAKKYGVGILRQVGESVEIDAEHLTAY